MRHLVSAMLVVVGVIHLLPLSGVLGSERLAALYGLPFDEPNLVILMRHRAVLFGLLGLFLCVAACRPAWLSIAFVAGIVSVVSFLWLARSVGGYNASLARVVVADVVAFVCLVIGMAAQLYVRRQG
ncbi:MAG: phosphopantetheine adenylyltransferase [Gemmatimonadota bacterium]